MVYFDVLKCFLVGYCRKRIDVILKFLGELKAFQAVYFVESFWCFKVISQKCSSFEKLISRLLVFFAFVFNEVLKWFCQGR